MAAGCIAFATQARLGGAPYGSNPPKRGGGFLAPGTRKKPTRATAARGNNAHRTTHFETCRKQSRMENKLRLD